MLAHPAFDHADDDLHGAGDVDRALRVARGDNGFGEFGAEAIARQPHDARAVNRAIEVPGEPRELAANDPNVQRMFFERLAQQKR